MCQITGFSAEELLSKNPLDFLDEESKKRFQERAKKLLAGEQVDDHIEYRMIDKDGSKRWIILNVKLTYKDGINDGAQVVGHDVTERIQMEAELRAANEELTRFNKAMVGRELRMIELKEEVNQLCGQSGQPPRYPLEFEKEEK
jgi:PAS domain S-box-containing protein